MTVGRLIEELKRCDPEIVVYHRAWTSESYSEWTHESKEVDREPSVVDLENYVIIEGAGREY